MAWFGRLVGVNVEDKIYVSVEYFDDAEAEKTYGRELDFPLGTTKPEIRAAAVAAGQGIRLEKTLGMNVGEEFPIP